MQFSIRWLFILTMIVGVFITFTFQFGIKLAIYGAVLTLLNLAVGFRFYDAWKGKGDEMNVRWAVVVSILVLYFDYLFLIGLPFK